MPNQEDRQPTLASEWPSQSLVNEARRLLAGATNKLFTDDDARTIVVGIANLFDVVGVARLAQEDDVA